jgi:aminodeoxyfutalosine synthase
MPTASSAVSSRKHNEEHGYTHSIDECLKIAREACEQGATELHIVGGLNTRLPFSYYTDLLSSIKREFPALHLKAFTMVEIDFFAKFYKMSDEETIERLKEAGLDSCPGGGAEVFAEATRAKVCTHKTDGNRWLEVAGKVHAAGLKTNATILYGHVETTDGPGRPPGPAARAAGSVGWFSVLHSARLLPAGNAARRICPGRRGSTA